MKSFRWPVPRSDSWRRGCLLVPSVTWFQHLATCLDTKKKCSLSYSFWKLFPACYCWALGLLNYGNYFGDVVDSPAWMDHFSHILPSPVYILTPLGDNFIASNAGLALWLESGRVGGSVSHVAGSPNVKTVSRSETLTTLLITLPSPSPGVW